MYLRLNTNSTCNIDCIHCYYKEKVWFDGKTLSLEDAQDIIYQAYDIYKEDLYVILMGWWEPLLYKDLILLLQFLFEKNISTSLTTNGLLLNENVLQQIKSLGVLLNISFEWTQIYNDLVRGEWVFKKVLKNILLCWQMWVRFSINFTLTKNNIIDIPYIVKLFWETSEYITFSRYIPYIKNDSIHPLSKQDYLLIERLLDKYKNKKLRYRQESFLKEKIVWKQEYIFDLKKLKSLYILPDQTVYPAWNLIDYKLWDLRTHSLLEILKNEKIKSLYNPEKLTGNYCSKCKYKYTCSWDRWTAYFYTWDFWWDDIQCPFYIP